MRKQMFLYFMLAAAICTSGCALLDFSGKGHSSGLRRSPAYTKVAVLIISDDWTLAQSAFNFADQHEFQIKGVFGLEQGALLSATYAIDKKAFEWQSFKAFKKKNRSGNYRKFLNENIFSKSVKKSSVKWWCPYFDKNLKTWLFHEEGSFRGGLYKCLSYSRKYSSSYSHLSILQVLNKISEQGYDSIWILASKPETDSILSWKRRYFLKSLETKDKVHVFFGQTSNIKNWSSRKKFLKKYSQEIYNDLIVHYELETQEEADESL